MTCCMGKDRKIRTCFSKVGSFVFWKKTDFVFKMVPFLEPKLGPPGSVLGFLFCWKTWCRAQFWPSMEGTQNGSKNGTDPQFGTAPKTEQKLNRKLFFGLFFEAALWHLLFLLQILSATHETAKPTSSLTPSSIYWNLPCALANVLKCVASHFFSASNATQIPRLSQR